jgi:hypothetical protein
LGGEDRADAKLGNLLVGPVWMLYVSSLLRLVLG